MRLKGTQATVFDGKQLWYQREKSSLGLGVVHLTWAVVILTPRRQMGRQGTTVFTVSAHRAPPELCGRKSPVVRSSPRVPFQLCRNFPWCPNQNCMSDRAYTRLPFLGLLLYEEKVCSFCFIYLFHSFIHLIYITQNESAWLILKSLSENSSKRKCWFRDQFSDSGQISLQLSGKKNHTFSLFFCDT